MDGYVTVSYNYNETVTFAGTHDPAFLLRVVRCHLYLPSMFGLP